MQKEGACYRIPGLEGIEIGLGCAHSVFRSVIALFRPDIHDKTDGEQVEIRNRDPDLHATQ